ncbi:MAG: AEC family transporter [Lachnospiraceae bacterium]|nr:AEC family transporter [Lachnospiraceae bacterium]
MDNLMYSINGTVPVFALIILGYFLRNKGIIGDTFVKEANTYVFRIALPVMIFIDMWKADIYREFDISFVVFCFLVTLISFAIIWIGAELFIKDKTMIGAFVQGSFRSSAAILGLAFVSNMYDGDLGMAPLMIIGCVPLYNICSVIVLTFRGKHSDYSKGKAGIKKALINIVTNPIIVGIFFGCIASLIKLKLPLMITKSLDLVAQSTVPIALIAIGGGFTFASSKTKKRTAVWGTVIKLILMPTVVLPIAVLFGYSNQEMLAIIIMIAGPATATGYAMAREMDNDYVLSSYMIVLTTMFSAFTLTAWIFIMKCLGALY